MNPDDFIQMANAGQVRTFADPRDKPAQSKAASGGKKRNALLSLLPTLTGVLGGVGGSFIAPGAGTVVGGAGGSAFGEWLAQKLNGEDTNVGAIAGEGALGSLGGVGKAFKAIKGAGKVTQATEAIADTSKAAPVTNGGIKGWLGGKLTGVANDTALRAAQVGGKKEALKKFDKRYGQDFGEYLRTNNVVGKGSKDIEESVVQPLNEKYGSLVKGINRPISSSDVLVQNQKELNKLLNSSSTANKKLADDVFQELSAVFKKNGDAIDAPTLNKIKAEFQSNARNSYKLGANAKPGVDEQVAKLLKKTLQGVSGSDELATTGKNIDKGYKAADIVASGEQNGRGNLNFGLTDMLAAGGGGAVGGVPGMVAGVAAKRVLNSPKTQSFIANKLANAGSKLSGVPGAPGVVPPVATGADAAKSYLKTQLPVRALQGATGAMAPAADAMGGGEAETFNPETQQDVASIMAAHGGADTMGSPDGGENIQKYTRANLMSDLQRDPKNSSYYLDLFKSLQEIDAVEKPPELNATQITQANNAVSALTDISSLRDTIDTDESVLLRSAIPGGSIARGLTGTTDFDAARQNITDVIGKLRSGAALTDQEAQRYLNLLPKYGDSKKSASTKLDRLETLLSRYANPEPAGGMDIASILTAK